MTDTPVSSPVGAIDVDATVELLEYLARAHGPIYESVRAALRTLASRLPGMLRDADRFDPEWIQAVQAIIEQARAAATAMTGSASVR